MIRKTLTIISLIGLLLSVGLWAASYFNLSYVHGNSILGLRFGCAEWARDAMRPANEQAAAFRQRLSELMAVESAWYRCQSR